MMEAEGLYPTLIVNCILTVEGDRGAGARENRGRDGYGRREKKGREAGSL